MSPKSRLYLHVVPTLMILFIAQCSRQQSDTDPFSSIHFSSEMIPEYRTIINASEDKLEYIADGMGDRVPDFSYCGYMASEIPVPDVPVKIIIPELPGDATGCIQKGIDYVSSLPLDENGYRGTVLLEKGVYEISGSLIIRASGVVLRGSGCGRDGTTLMGAGVHRETLIRVAGGRNRKTEEQVPLADRYFPVNAIMGGDKSQWTGIRERIHCFKMKVSLL